MPGVDAKRHFIKMTGGIDKSDKSRIGGETTPVNTIYYKKNY